MALIKCENCGKIISDKAKKCPQCKIKLKRKKQLRNIKYAGILAIIVVIISGFFLAYNQIIKLDLEDVKKSVVMVEIYDKKGDLVGTGSGFCAFESNLIVTNYHVIEDSYLIKIKTDDKKRHSISEVVVYDKVNDLAILRSKIDLLTPLKLGNSKKIKTGAPVIAIGSPLGELNTVSTGIISNADNDKGIQISAPISHGSSGGALFDKNYHLIGITYAGYDDAQNLNYAISVDYLEKLYNKYKN